ncbi:MAG: hypothetical protein H9W80_12575 [Enterococcus sp.]|nr:hypothetical protein [Enterococcus sp.]
MGTVIVEGAFLNAEIKKKSFEGKETTDVYIDVYQQDSQALNKLVQIKSSDVEVYQQLVNDYPNGTMIKVKCTVSAYQNKAYFKLVDVI